MHDQDIPNETVLQAIDDAKGCFVEKMPGF